MSVVKPKSKQLLWPITKDTDSSVNQSEFEVLTSNRCQARVVLAERREFCRPIKVWTKSKPKQMQITFDTRSLYGSKDNANVNGSNCNAWRKNKIKACFLFLFLFFFFSMYAPYKMLHAYVCCNQMALDWSWEIECCPAFAFCNILLMVSCSQTRHFPAQLSKTNIPVKLLNTCSAIWSRKNRCRAFFYDTGCSRWPQCRCLLILNQILLRALWGLQGA